MNKRDLEAALAQIEDAIALSPPDERAKLALERARLRASLHEKLTRRRRL